jgi:hypothetical protein
MIRDRFGSPMPAGVPDVTFPAAWITPAAGGVGILPSREVAARKPTFQEPPPYIGGYEYVVHV